MELYRASSTYYTTFTTFVCLLSVKMRFLLFWYVTLRSYLKWEGQSLSRRYCTHSVWLFLCASRTASSSQALWRFRVSTSNSLSDRSWPPTNTQIREIYRTYAQQDIQVCGDDHFQPPMRQLSKSRSFDFFVSIWVPRDDHLRQLLYTPTHDRTLICNEYFTISRLPLCAAT